jgi:hypothetical protein
MVPTLSILDLSNKILSGEIPSNLGSFYIRLRGQEEASDIHARHTNSCGDLASSSSNSNPAIPLHPRSNHRLVALLVAMASRRPGV